MAENASPLQDEVAIEIEGILTPIKEKREALVTQESEYKAKLATVQGGIRSLDRILSAAQPKAATAKPARKSETRFSQDSLNELFGKLKESFGSDPFTVATAVEKTGIPKSRIYPSTRALRETGRLLKVGVDKENRGASLFMIAPEEGS